MTHGRLDSQSHTFRAVDALQKAAVLFDNNVEQYRGANHGRDPTRTELQQLGRNSARGQPSFLIRGQKRAISEAVEGSKDVELTHHIRAPAKSEDASDQSAQAKSSVFLRLNGAADTAAAHFPALAAVMSGSETSADRTTAAGRYEITAAEHDRPHAVISVDKHIASRQPDSDVSEQAGRQNSRRGRAHTGMASDAIAAERSTSRQTQKPWQANMPAPSLPAKPLSAKQLCQMIGSHGRVQLSSQLPPTARKPFLDQGSALQSKPAASRDALSHDDSMRWPENHIRAAGQWIMLCMVTVDLSSSLFPG
ncbi:hypothetical protein WJX84_009580 [Apatococcus fuscideae]|uniref:Uncharacterized protein n=1 Tax=Apatococcus fuscideae TaxID=2026836 RepID=A0AAW1TCA0_9CHLO